MFKGVISALILLVQHQHYWSMALVRHFAKLFLLDSCTGTEIRPPFPPVVAKLFPSLPVQTSNGRVSPIVSECRGWCIILHCRMGSVFERHCGPILSFLLLEAQRQQHTVNAFVFIVAFSFTSTRSPATFVCVPASFPRKTRVPRHCSCLVLPLHTSSIIR